MSPGNRKSWWSGVALVLPLVTLLGGCKGEALCALGAKRDRTGNRATSAPATKPRPSVIWFTR
jgi:hypothetical protein